VPQVQKVLMLRCTKAQSTEAIKESKESIKDQTLNNTARGLPTVKVAQDRKQKMVLNRRLNASPAQTQGFMPVPVSAILSRFRI